MEATHLRNPELTEQERPSVGSRTSSCVHEVECELEEKEELLASAKREISKLVDKVKTLESGQRELVQDRENLLAQVREGSDEVTSARRSIRRSRERQSDDESRNARRWDIVEQLLGELKAEREHNQQLQRRVTELDERWLTATASVAALESRVIQLQRYSERENMIAREAQLILLAEQRKGKLLHTQVEQLRDELDMERLQQSEQLMQDDCHHRLGNHTLAMEGLGGSSSSALSPNSLAQELAGATMVPEIADYERCPELGPELAPEHTTPPSRHDFPEEPQRRQGCARTIHGMKRDSPWSPFLEFLCVGCRGTARSISAPADCLACCTSPRPAHRH